MNFPIGTKVVIKDNSELDGQHGYVFALNKDDNPFLPPKDKGFRQIAIEGMRGEPVQVPTDKLQKQ